MDGGVPCRIHAQYRIFVTLPRKNSQTKLNLNVSYLYAFYHSAKSLSPCIHVHDSVYYMPRYICLDLSLFAQHL